MCLGAGYAWLALGLLALGLTTRGGPRTGAIHAITVGAMGTLTFNVMAGTVLQRARRDRAREPRLIAGTALIALAATLRILAAVDGGEPLPLLIAAASLLVGGVAAARHMDRRHHRPRTTSATLRLAATPASGCGSPARVTGACRAGAQASSLVRASRSSRRNAAPAFG